MQQTTDDAHAAAVRELAARLYRNLETRNGRTYWKPEAPRGLQAWATDVRVQSPYEITDVLEFYHVLYQLCALVFDRGRGTMQDITAAVARNTWADSNGADLLCWLQDDERRIALVDAHLHMGSVLHAAREAQDSFRPLAREHPWRRGSRS